MTCEDVGALELIASVWCLELHKRALESILVDVSGSESAARGESLG